jgi:hypothetical protein
VAEIDRQLAGSSHFNGRRFAGRQATAQSGTGRHSGKRAAATVSCATAARAARCGAQGCARRSCSRRCACGRSWPLDPSLIASVASAGVPAGPAAMPDHHRMGGERDTPSRRGTRQDRAHSASINQNPARRQPRANDRRPRLSGAHHPRRYRGGLAVVPKDRISRPQRDCSRPRTPRPHRQQSTIALGDGGCCGGQNSSSSPMNSVVGS